MFIHRRLFCLLFSPIKHLIISYKRRQRQPNFTTILILIIITAIFFLNYFLVFSKKTDSSNPNYPVIWLISDNDAAAESRPRLNTYYNSNCWCKRDERVRIVTFNSTHFSVEQQQQQQQNVETISPQLLYYISKVEFMSKSTKFTCNSYVTLKRGPHQNVISYSLFGTKPFYSKKLRKLSEQVRERYPPGWLIRVYHDQTINRSLICDIECAHAGNVVDFCDVEKIRWQTAGGGEGSNNKKKVSELVLPRMWRFLAIGDSFVDVFASRDTDSFILQREVDAVNEWLVSSGKSAHVMRDHWLQGFAMLAGMWGFRSGRSRDLANRIFAKILNEKIIKIVNPRNSKPKGYQIAKVIVY